MSSIDQYQYKCLGVIECPSSDAWFGDEQWGGILHVAIYRLNEDIPPDETDFQGKKGDILLGGGSGEAPALRISIPEAFRVYTHNYLEWDDDFPYTGFQIYTQIVTKAYWSMTQACHFCEGYRKLGWTTAEEIEAWLMQHILSFLTAHYSDDYKKLVGSEALVFDGHICRLLSPEEDQIWNWRDYLKPDPDSPADNDPNKLIYRPIPKQQKPGQH